MCLGILLAGEHCGRAAVGDAGRIARGHQPIFLEVRLQPAQDLERRLRPHVLVGAELDFLPFHFDGHRHDFVLERACVPGALRALLRGDGDFIHFFARELVLLGEALGGLGHREAALRIFQRLPQQILERRGAKPEAPARATHDVRRLAHRLGAAREYSVGLAEQDQLRALRDRLEA